MEVRKWTAFQMDYEPRDDWKGKQEQGACISDTGSWAAERYGHERNLLL